jgi:glycosyltransferase involved in cell wall biosynthesis
MGNYLSRLLFIFHHSAPYHDHLLNRLLEEGYSNITLVLLQEEDGKHSFGDYEQYYGETIYLKNVIPKSKRHLNLSILKNILNNDIIFISSYVHLTSILVLLSAVVFNKTIVFSNDNTLIQLSEKSFFKKFVLSVINKTLDRIVDAFWVPGQASVNYYMKYGVARNKIFTGRYALNSKEVFLENSEDVSALKNSLSISSNDFVFLTVSGLTKNRNINILIKCFNEINIEFPESRLVIVGSGPELSNLKKLASDNNNIHFAGNIFFLELNKYFSMATVYITLSSEPYSLTIPHAALLKIPVISSCKAGASLDYFDSFDEYLIDPNSSEEVIQAMRSIIQDKSKRNKIAHKLNMRAQALRNNYAVKQLKQCLMFLNGRGSGL